MNAAAARNIGPPTEDRIMAVLRAADGCVSRSDLAKKASVRDVLLPEYMRNLIKQKLVTIVGDSSYAVYGHESAAQKSAAFAERRQAFTDTHASDDLCSDRAAQQLPRPRAAFGPRAYAVDSDNKVKRCRKCRLLRPLAKYHAGDGRQDARVTMCDDCRGVAVPNSNKARVTKPAEVLHVEHVTSPAAPKLLPQLDIAPRAGLRGYAENGAAILKQGDAEIRIHADDIRAVLEWLSEVFLS